MSYEFTSTLPGFSLRQKAKYIRWFNQCLKKEKKKAGNILYIFCPQPQIIKINRQYLGHNYATDVITFDYSAGMKLSGEIYVSPQTVRYHARTLGIPVAVEMRRVMIHALLHLSGYRDKTKNEIKVMRAKEDFYLLLWTSICNEKI